MSSMLEHVCTRNEFPRTFYLHENIARHKLDVSAKPKNLKQSIFQRRTLRFSTNESALLPYRASREDPPSHKGAGSIFENFQASKQFDVASKARKIRPHNGCRNGHFRKRARV